MGNLLNLMKMNAESSAMDTDPEFENFKNKANSSRELSYLESQYGDFLDPDRADTESFVMGSSNKDYIFGDEYLDGIKDLNEYRAQQQSGFNKTMSGLGRVGVKVAAEVAKMPGMIGGLVGGLITAPFSEEPLIETIFNNAWIRTIEDANQYINNEALPVYVKNSVKNGNLIDNLTSIDFWATEGADGVGYIASMFVPGAVLKSLGLGKIMMKGASKGAKGMYKSAEAAQDALESIKATDKGMDVFNATVANTFFEAGAESGGAMRAFESKKENFINKQLEKGLTEEEAEQFFIESKADLGRNIFWSNVAILVGPNAISNKILFGAKRGSKVASDYIDDAGKILTDPKSIFTAKNIAGYGKELVKGGAREGFWEEAMQSSVEHMYMNEAEDNENASITGVVNSYIHTLTTVDGQKAIALGALLGGPMNAYSKYSNDKVSEKRRQKLAPAMEKALGLFNLDPSKLFTINEETGKREINQEFAVKYGEEVKKLEAMSQLYDKIEAVKEENNGVLPQKDKAVAKANINNFISAFLLPFITNGEMGVEILEKSLKQNEDLIDKVNAQNKAFGENENRESYTAKIVEQAKNMQKDYEKSTEYLKYFTPIETSSENKEDLNEFYKEMNMLETFAKQNKRFLEKNKSKAETEFAELEIEALKNYQLKTETSKTQYKNISKFSNVKTKEGGALNISNIPSISFEEFQNKKDGFNSKDSFLEWYQNQPKSKLYNSKKNEILSAATAILNEESTIETLYDEKLLKQYFEQTLKEKKDKAEKIKELEKTIAEEEKKKNEEAEEEIIKKDNKAKKTREQKNANKKRTKLVNKVNNNNLLLDTLLTELDKQGKDVIIEPLTQDLIDIISQTNLDIEGLKIGNQIKYNKAVNNTINFEVLDVEIIDENDRTVSRIELSRQEVPKEKKPPVEDDTTHTTNDEQEEVDNVEEEEEKSDLEKINKAEQKELEINLIGEEVLVGNLINRPPTKGTIKEIKIINKPGFKPQLGFFSSEIGNVFFNDINKTSKLYSVVKEIKAKYQAQRDALNSFSQQPTNKENKNEFFEKEKNNVTKTGLFMVSIASSRGKYEKIEKTVSDPNEVDVLNTKNENGITNYPDSNAKNSINAKNEILNVKVSLKKDKSTNELVLSGHIKAQFPKTTESSRDQAVGIALPIGNSTLNEKQLLTFYEKALIKILKSYLNSSTTNEMYNGEKIYTDRAEIARQLKKEWDIAMELSKSKEKLNSNSSNEFTNSDNISTGTFINEEISNEVNNLPENKQKEEDRTDAKVVDLKGSLSSNSEFFEYTEKQKNKLGEKVSFELGNPQSNKLASDALLKFKKILKNEERTELTEEEIEEFANYLPIKVLTKNGGYSHLSFLNKKNDERGNINVYKTTYELKKGIILEILKGNKPTSTIKFQMPGKIQMDRVNGKPAVNKIYDENGKANVFGIESLNNVQVLFSDSQGTLRNSNHDQVDSFNSVKHAGQVYISIKMANGRTIPLKLNQRRINNLEAEIIYKIVEAMTGSSIKLSYKDNLDMLMESVIFTKEERDYVFNELKALNKKSKNTNIISFFSNFVYKGNTDKNAFSIEGSSLRMKDQLIPFSELAGAKKEIIEWLTTEKNRQINKQASNTTAYKKHLFNSIISTDVKLGQPVFQGSTAIYLDPSMGNNPIDIKPNKKKTEPVVKKEPTKKTTIKAIKDKKKQNPENSQYSKEEQEYLNNVEDYRNRKIKDSNKQVLEETNTITYEKAEFLDNLYDVIPVNNKTEAKKAKKANKNSPTLEHIIKPVVVNKSTRSKSKYANMMKKANAKKNEDNDLNEGCNK